MDSASPNTVGVSQAELRATERNGLPQMHRRKTAWRSSSTESQQSASARLTALAASRMALNAAFQSVEEQVAIAASAARSWCGSAVIAYRRLCRHARIDASDMSLIVDFSFRGSSANASPASAAARKVSGIKCLILRQHSTANRLNLGS